MSKSDATVTPWAMALTDVLELLDTTRDEDAPPLRLRVKPDRRRTQIDWPPEKERRGWRRPSPSSAGDAMNGEGQTTPIG